MVLNIMDITSNVCGVLHGAVVNFYLHAELICTQSKTAAILELMETIFAIPQFSKEVLKNKIKAISMV